MHITIDNEIELLLLEETKTEWFFNAIHEKIDKEDRYRSRMQERYKNSEDIQNRLIDAYENKYLKDGTPDFFIVVEGRLAGVFEFAPLVEGVEYVEVGYWLFAEYQGRGIMSRTLREMLVFGQKFGRPRIRACTGADNTSSCRLLENCGFKNTGQTETIVDREGTSETNVIFEFALESL